MIRLCSSSETRAKLLHDFGVDFVQSGVDFDEDSIVASSAKEFVYLASVGKLQKAEMIYALDVPLLSADTVVVGANGEILRKAKDEEDARYILSVQSGSKISIITAMHFKSSKFYFNNISSTTYQFLEFKQSDIDAYIKSGDWMGKAGACMVEGFCKPYIWSVHGLESNAMGLGVEVLQGWIDFLKN